MKVRENDKPSAQHSRFLKMFKQLRLEIGLKDALVEMPKFNKWLSSFLLRPKKGVEEISLYHDRRMLNAPLILMKQRSRKARRSRASINLLPHSIYKKLGLEALTPTRMTLELANRSITSQIRIGNKPEDVKPFLRTAKALIDLYEEKLTLRVGKEELVYYADKSEKNKEKNFVHAISIIDFSKDDPFSGSTTNTPPPSSSPVKTSDNLEKFADELTPLDSLPLGNDDSTLKKDFHEVNFQVYSNTLFEFDDKFKSSNVNPLFEENDKDVEIKSDSIPPGIDLTLPPTLEVSSSNPTSLTLTGEKYFKKDFTTESSILPPPLLDSDSPFTAELSASVTLNSLGNEDKVFKPGILVFHAIHDKNLITLEENLKENISSGTLLVSKEPSFLLPPPEPPDKCLNFEPILVMKNVVLNVDFYQRNVEDVNSVTFIIWIFLPYFPYPEESPLIFSFRSENFVFDPGIITFHKPVDQPNKFFEASRVWLICPVLLELLILCVKLVWGDPYPFIIID
ncbi:hypothetical protein Tco_1119245 [Tanacetum coccineum]